MTALIRKAFLLLVCGFFLVSVAGADAPDPMSSSVPTFINVGGARSTNNPVPDGSLAFTITVRDAVAPLAGSSVEVDFVDCFDTYLCTAVVAGQVVDCSGSTRTVTGTTNVAGQVTLSILGAGKQVGVMPPGYFPGAGRDCIRVYANDPAEPTTRVLLGRATSVVYDKNGATSNVNNGVNGGDAPFFLEDLRAVITDPTGTLYLGRNDYSRDGAVNGADASYYLVGNTSIVGRSAFGTGSGVGCYGSGPNGSSTFQPYCP